MVCFEPAVLNLDVLASNIYSNNLTNKVVNLPQPLSSQFGLNTLNMTSTEWEGSLSILG